MTIYAMGNTAVEFNNTGNIAIVNSANDTYYDPGYASWAQQLGATSHPFPLGGLTDVWMGFTMGNTVGSASENSTATIFDIRTSGGQGIVRLQNTTGPVRTFQYWNGSAWTNIGTLTGSATRHGKRIDVRCKIAASGGEFSIYVDRVLQQTLTGNTDFFSATIDGFQFNNWGQFNGRAITDIVVADEDTRKIRVLTRIGTGNSATNTGWTGGFGNIDEIPTSNYTAADTDASVSSAGGQDMSFTKASIGNFGDDGQILAVQVSARAKNDGSSADFDLLLRSGGANYTASHQRTIDTTNRNGYAAVWNTDPATSVAWTKSGVDAVEFGMSSKNAGVSTIYLMTFTVAIRDDFIEPWESTYPSTDENIAIVEVTAPGSTGYVDVTIPAMVADGCSPKLAILMTNARVSNSPSGGALQFIGFVSNERDSTFASKGEVAYFSADASGSSSTQRAVQTRTKLDFATANGGWLIDNSALRVRFEKFIEGGVRLFYEITTSGRTFSVMFFWGDNLEVQHWFVNLGTGTSAIANTGIGFEPEGGLFFSAGSTIGFTTTAYWSIGIASDDGSGLEQRTLMRYSPSGNAAGPAPLQMIDNTAIAGLLNPTGPAVTWDLTLNSFDADGFTVTPSASASSAFLYAFLFRHTGGKKMKVLDITTPTVTGVTAHTGAGFTPRAALGVMSSLQSVNTIVQDAEQASSMNFFAVAPDLAVKSVTIVEDTVLDPSDCNSYQDSVHALRLGTNGSGTVAALIGELTAFNGDGITVDYTAVTASAKLGFVLLFEGDGLPPLGSPGYSTFFF